jgi:hypothetical protein
MQELSPRSRKAKLASDICKIDEELEGLSQDMGSVSSQVYFDPEVKLLQVQNEKQELQQKIKKISLSTNCKESLLRSQLLEINSQIQFLQGKKQSEHAKIIASKDKCIEEIRVLKDKLAKLEQDYSVISKSCKNKIKFQNESAQAKLKSYQETVADLEKKLDQISAQKDELREKSEKNLKINENLKNRISMTKEELQQLYYMRAEFIAENEQAEEELEVLREELLESVESEELQDYFEGSKKIKAEQEATLVKIRETQVKLEETKKELENLEKNQKNIEENLEKIMNQLVPVKVELEITNLEKLLNETCENMGINTLEDVILALNSFENFDLDEEILKIQLQKVETEEALLKDHWQNELNSLQETLKILSEDKDEKSRIEKIYKQKFKEFYNKTAGISQWKNEVLAALSKSKPYSGPVKDRAVFLAFRNSCISKIDNLQSQKSFENVVSSYIDKVTNREKIIQENHKKIAKLRIALEQTLFKVKESKSGFFFLEKIKAREQMKLGKLMVKEKSLILLVKSSDPGFISQVERLSKMISFWSDIIQRYSERIDVYLKPALQTSNESLKHQSKETQLCKVILKDLSEEENSLTIQLEKVLENQHSFMLTSFNESSPEPDLSDLTSEIEIIANKISFANKKVSQLDHEFYSVSAKLEEEENILNLKLRSITSALSLLTNEQKKLEDFETRLHKIEENEAAPIPECMNDRTRAKSMNKIKVSSQETPEKPQNDEYLTSSKYFPKTFLERSPKPYKSKIEEPNSIEKALLEKLSPLLEGAELYKRFSQRSSLKQEEFDPLDSKKLSPEACGYGLRVFKLSKCLSRVDVKHQLRQGFDSSLPVESILKIIIPQTTSAILKVQKKIGKGEIDCTDRTFAGGTYESMKERGFFDTKSKVFIERCSSCKWFPFSIALTEGGRIEVIAKTYPVFKNWVNGINCLIKNKKIVQKVKNRIQV